VDEWIQLILELAKEFEEQAPPKNKGLIKLIEPIDYLVRHEFPKLLPTYQGFIEISQDQLNLLKDIQGYSPEERVAESKNVYLRFERLLALLQDTSQKLGSALVNV